jgi:adenosylcobinamide-GDP ribazoletransferase
MSTLPYVRQDSVKTKPLATVLTGGRLACALATGAGALLLLPVRFWWAAFTVLAARLILAAWFKRRLGGFTGDCLGAAQQVCEVVFYLSILALR